MRGDSSKSRLTRGDWTLFRSRTGGLSSNACATKWRSIQPLFRSQTSFKLWVGPHRLSLPNAADAGSTTRTCRTSVLGWVWVYIHHSMLYTTLSIAVPEGVDVFAQPYSQDELTQRATVQ